MLKRSPLFFALLLASPWQAWAESSVVLSSTAGAYQVGQELASGRQISLKAGEKLTLITESGVGMELSGPYIGLPAATSVKSTAQSEMPGVAPAIVKPQKQLKTLVQRLTAQQAVETGALGVIRQPMPTAVFNPVMGSGSVLQSIPVGLNGRFCIEKSTRVLNFKGANRGQVLQLKAVNPSQKTGSSTRYQQLAYNASANAWAWPSNLPRAKGGKYLLRDGEASIPYLIDLYPVQLPSKPDQISRLYLAAFLAAKGCAWQSQALTDSSNE